MPVVSQIPSYNTLTMFGTGHDEVGGAGDIVVLEDGRIFLTRDDPSAEYAADGQPRGINVVELAPDFSLLGTLVFRNATLNALAFDAENGVFYVAVDAAGNVFVVDLTGIWPSARLPRDFDLFDPNAAPDPGGYRRFAGSVTLYPADGGEPVPLASDLDAPTNITYADGELYVSLGQGTPGRSIIGPAGLTQIVGEIYRIAVE